MSTRRRTRYKPPKDRREVTMAILAATAIVLVTAVLVWVLRPNKEAATQPPANLPAPTTLQPIDTTAPATTAPATT